jgi:hypothetical protein
VNAGRHFNEISIDPEQEGRSELKLTNYIPLYVGYYRRYCRGEINDYLCHNYDDPVIYNGSFYGSLNKTLRTNLGDDYENIILLLIHNDRIRYHADNDLVRLFNNIAIKSDTIELICNSYDDFNDKVLECKADGERVYCELDILDNNQAIRIPDDIEAIIVDNERIKNKIISKISRFDVNLVQQLKFFICPLPREKQA